MKRTKYLKPITVVLLQQTKNALFLQRVFNIIKMLIYALPAAIKFNAEPATNQPI
jgi:hypothetical protein